MIKQLILFSLLFFSMVSWAGSTDPVKKTLLVRVLDAQTTEDLTGVRILDMHSNQVFYSDEHGYFEIDHTPGTSIELELSFISFVPKLVSIDASNIEGNISIPLDPR